MKYILATLILFFPLTTYAAPVSIEVEPKGCHFSCDGWEITYVGKHKNANGVLDHKDDLIVFVWNKQQSAPNDKQDWAVDVVSAQKIADEKAKKVGLQ